jgi:hypothetical protein
VPAANGCPGTINAGQVVECGQVAADFEVKGDHEFAVAAFTLGASIVDPGNQPPNQKGDPDLSLFASVEQYRTKYVFLAPSDYDVNFVDVVGPTGTTLNLDGAPVTASFKAVSAAYGVARIPLTAGANNGAHLLTGTQPIGIQVMGYGAYTSYQYPGGLDLSQIAPPPPK